MANQDIEVRDGDDRQEESQYRGKGLLDYTLLVDDDAVVFTLHKQAPEVTHFLEQIGTFMASNGMRIQLGYEVQWKDSTNTIMLDAGINPKKQLNKPDITYLAKQLHHKNQAANGVHQMVRNKVTMFELALQELVEVVKKSYNVGKDEDVKAIRRVLN